MRTFSHESGHAIDLYKDNGEKREIEIRMNKDFRKVYEEEKSAIKSSFKHCIYR